MLPTHCSVRVFTPTSSESGVTSYLSSPAKPVRLEFWSDWVFAEGEFDMRTFNAPVAVAKARAKFPYVEAIDPDLRAFQRRGGKLLLYHGWAEAAPCELWFTTRMVCV
jgi:hypothetical protein